MQNVQEATQAPAKPRAPEGTWIQITFTLDPAHYQMLWQRAEEKHRTLPALVRESATCFLEEIKNVS